MKPTKKQITYDIDTKIAEQILGKNYSNLYEKIERFLKKKDFSSVQKSVYVANKPISSIMLKLILIELKTKYPYLDKCIRDIRQTSITTNYTLNNLFHYDGTPGPYKDYYLRIREQKESATSKDASSKDKQQVNEDSSTTAPTKEKLRLFVDIDGTLAVFKPVETLEILYEKGYFLNLEPHKNVVDAVGELYFQEIPEEFVTVGAAVDFMDLDSVCILPEEEQREIKKLFGRSEG